MKTCNRLKRMRRVGGLILATAIASFAAASTAAEVEDKGQLALDRVVGARFELGGFAGNRVRANIEHWLLAAPGNNPGLLDMFSRRDSGEKPNLVPWAGEFVGKYLISSVQALRMSDDETLKQSLRQVVDRLIALQADDGYLGPWPKDERLRGHWDLWGHYHVMLGLMLWHEQTGDQQAATTARRIADLVCDTCLETDFRVVNAGSPEMNMAIIHGMARIYRKTGEDRYLRMALEVLKDFEDAGDYYRTGLDGKEYYRTPRPRWESLHCLQGLVDLYQITGDESYRRAFLHHWASIRRFDFRNTGGFSSGERATGNPYVNDAIETCCVVAWQEVMIDALRLTGESISADDLELATLNAMLGAQHPSGAWCTYNTPMEGQRIPSHVHINFQARPDTPHLNCCSVNGPRGYGSITQWGLMRDAKRLVVNYYGPMKATAKLADGTSVGIVEETDYPVSGDIKLKMEPEAERQFTLALRIPAWSKDTRVAVNGQAVSNVEPGSYLELDRRWKAGDCITLGLDMSVRYEPGDLQQLDTVSLYRGPILLARDSRFAEGESPAIDVTRLSQARLVPTDDEISKAAGKHKPWLVVDVPAAENSCARLIDFASAGATTVEGKPVSNYATWLPARAARPPKPVAWQPADRSALGPGAVRFVWRKPAGGAMATRKHSVVISESPTFESTTLAYGDAVGNWLLIPKEEATKLKQHTPYFWKIVARNRNGQAESSPLYKQFHIDPAAPPLANNWPYGQRTTDQMIVAAPLDGQVKPSYGTLVDAKGWKPTTGLADKNNDAIETDGTGGMVRYKVLTFPEEQFTVSIWVLVVRESGNRYGQIFSAWTAGMDDPLRLFVSGGKLSARIEAGRSYDTEQVPIETGKWYHVAAVKDGTKLTLYVDGQARSTVAAPAHVVSAASDFALGGNPHYRGTPEFLQARLADLRFYARALSAEEIKGLAKHQADKD